MNRIHILEGYDAMPGYDDFGVHHRERYPGDRPRRRRRRKMSAKQRKQAAKFRRAAKHCKRHRRGSFKVCMKKQLKKRRRR